jgi:hypothetical protein
MGRMFGSRSKPAPRTEAPASSGRTLARLEFEMALDLVGDVRNRQWADVVRQAANAAGGDLALVLPFLDEAGKVAEQAVVRLMDEGQSRFFQIRPSGGSYAIADEGEIAADLLGFARASIDVLERLKADQSITTPVAASAN